MNGQRKSFLNPYHFLPLPENWDSVKGGYLERDKAKAVLKDHAAGADAVHLRHDQFGAGLYSGRILCRLTTVSPCVFGNEHKPLGKWSAMVRNYEMHGKPAIASTQLRGLISTIAEAATGSSMRVLVNRGLSFRSVPPSGADPSRRQLRSAIGMVVGEPGHRRLLPLTLPGLECSHNGGLVSLKLLDARDAWVGCLRELPASATQDLPVSLGAYIGGYAGSGGQTHQLRGPKGVLAKEFNGQLAQSHCHRHFLQLWKLKARWLGLRLRGSELEVYVDGARLSHSDVSSALHLRGGRYPLAINLSAAEENTLEPVGDGESLSDLRAAGWRVGVIRRLAPPRRQDASLFVPATKKHELFIPIEHHLDLESGGLRDYGTALPEAESACVSFERNANSLSETHKDGRPLRLLGQSRGTVRLLEGDLVHFRFGARLDAETGRPVVDSVAISSIWREDAGDLFHYFGAHGLEELLPFTEARNHLSRADQLFGFVEQSESAGGSDKSRRGELTAYASRVRFSAARLHENAQPPAGGFYLSQGRLEVANDRGQREGWYPLKILSSPKPPCPEFYFESPDGKRVERPDLKPVDPKPRPQGWKIYLHDPDAAKMKQVSTKYKGTTQGIYTWETQYAEGNSARENQKMLVRPVDRGVEFFFHVDFHNLKMEELGILRHALQPHDGYHHRLGLAKPLGLGTVKIEPLGLFIVKRRNRYEGTNGLLARARRPETRYHLVATKILKEERRACCDRLPLRYRREADALRNAGARAEVVEANWDTDLGFQPAAGVHHALELVGNPNRIEELQAELKAEHNDLLVHYPYLVNPEDRLFEWYKKHRAECNLTYLKPLKQGSGLIDVVLRQHPGDPDPAAMLETPDRGTAAW